MRFKRRYPENILYDLRLNETCGGMAGLNYEILTEDQMRGLDFLLHQATERECRMLQMRYIEGLSVREIAEKYQCSRNRVRQILDHALKKLQDRDLLLYVMEGYEMRLESRHGQLEQEEQKYCQRFHITDRAHLYYQDIHSVKLPYRVMKACILANICEIRELIIRLQYKDGFRNIRGFGEGSRMQVEELLKKEGLIPAGCQRIRGKMPCTLFERDLGAFRNLNRYG